MSTEDLSKAMADELRKMADWVECGNVECLVLSGWGSGKPYGQDENVPIFDVWVQDNHQAVIMLGVLDMAKERIQAGFYPTENLSDALEKMDTDQDPN